MKFVNVLTVGDSTTRDHYVKLIYHCTIVANIILPPPMRLYFARRLFVCLS